MRYLRSWHGTVARLIVGALFLWSALVKLADPRAFLRGVVAYDATPDWLARAIAYGLPVLELCVAVLLIVGILTRIAASVAVVLQLVFLIGVIELAARGIHVDTGAFGTGGVTTHSTHYLLVALLNVVLILLSAVLVVAPLSLFSVEEFLARGDYVEMPSPKRMRSEQGRRKYESEVAIAQHSARERNRYITAGLTIPIVLISFIAIGVQAKRANPASDTAANASHVLGISVGFSNAPVTIDVFEDFQSTASLALEQKLGAELDKLAVTSTRQVRYHMVAIYDASSKGNRYSSRAANAGVCASDISVLDFRKYHRYLFGVDGNKNQIMPAVGSHGRTDTSLITYGQDSLGISGTDLTTFQTCVQSEQHKATVEATTLNFTNRGLTQVPVVLVNGAKLKTLTVAGLDAAVATAATKAAAAAAKAAKDKPKATTSSTGSAAAPSSAAPSSTPTNTSTPVSSAPVTSSALASTTAASSTGASSTAASP
jgi:uncharacterized membrane protein YphA (DoxX/SURF4 family)/protein-disulfide isomerase